MITSTDGSARCDHAPMLVDLFDRSHEWEEDGPHATRGEVYAPQAIDPATAVARGGEFLLFNDWRDGYHAAPLGPSRSDQSASVGELSIARSVPGTYAPRQLLRHVSQREAVDGRAGA